MLRLIALRLMESYFRHRWLYLAPIALMMALAFAYFFLAKPKYIANGILFVQRESLLARLTSVNDPNISWQTPATVTMGELNELLQTDAFIRAVISQTDLEAQMDKGQSVVNQTIDDVRKAVWVTSIGNNQVSVSASNERPNLASQLADATITSFVQWKINADRTDSEAAHSFFTDIITKYKADLDLARQNMNDYLLAHPDPIKGERPVTEQLEVKRLQSEIDLAQARYASALNKDEDARLAALQAESDARQSYVIIDAPRVPTKPDVSLKQTAIKMVVFVVVGLFLSGIGVVGGAVLDRSFRFPVDVWHGVNLPVLAMVPDGDRLTKRKKLKRLKKVKELDREAVSVEKEMKPSGELVEGESTEKEAELASSASLEEETSVGKEDELIPAVSLEEEASAEKETGIIHASKQKKMKSSAKRARLAQASNEDEGKLAGETLQETDGEGDINQEINPEAMRIFGAAMKESENGEADPTK